MATRPHDEERVERERQENTASRKRAHDEERSRQSGARGPAPRDDGAQLHKDATPRQRLEHEKDEEGFVERIREEKQHHDFIERTKPDDPSDNLGQLTRDNVNPDIPSAEPGTGPIVQPESNSGGVPPPKTEESELPEPLRAHSINEPPGSDVIPGADTGPNQLPGDGSALPPGTELPPLVLSDISPDSADLGSMVDFVLTVIGSGFTPNSVILFDDEELPTTFVNQTTMTASPPTQAEAGIVDVEVARGEDLSDVLTFEFVAPAGRRSSEKAERRPKKNTPISRRADKKKGKK